MADEIRIGVATDISALKAGLAEAQAAVQAAASNMADAQAAFGKAAEQGSEQAAAALAEYTAGVDAAREKLEALRNTAAEAGVLLGRPRAATAGVAVAAPPTGLAAAGEQESEGQLEVAAATLEQVAARKALNEVIAETIKAEIDDDAALSSIAAAQERLIAATEALVEAQANLAASEDFAALSAQQEVGTTEELSAAELQLAEATLEAKAAKSALSDAVAQLQGRRDAESAAVVAAAQRREAEAAEQLALAKKNLADVREYEIAVANKEVAVSTEVAAASEVEAGAMNAVAAASARSVSEMTAATTGARLVTGSMMGASRGAAAFAVTSLGLGPILQAAFPIIGAVALISILIDLGEKLYDVEKKANEATDAIGREFDVANQKMQVNLDDIELTNSKLQDQIDKLEHHPGNGLQTALLEAIAAADKLQEKLNADNQSLEALLKKHEVTQLTSLITGQAPTTGINKDIEDEHQKLTLSTAQITVAYDEQFRAAAGDKDKIAGAIDARTQATKAAYDRYISTLTISLNQQYALQRKNDEEKKALEGAAVTPGYGGIAARAPDVDYSPGIKTLEEQLAQAKLSQQITIASMETQPLEAKKGGLEQKKQDASLANQAREQKLKVLEQGLEDEQAVYGKSANQTAAYWDKYIGTFAYGTDQLRAVEQKLNAAREQEGKREPASDLFGKVHEQAKKQNEELKKDSEEYQRILDTFSKGTVEIQQPKEQQEQQQALAQSAHQEQLSQLEESHQKAQLPFDVGLISNAQKQLADLKAFHQAVQQENLRFDVEQLANTPGNNAQIVAATEKAQDQLTAAEQSGDQKRIELAQQALEKEVALLVQANSKETGEMKSLQDKLTATVHQGNMERLQDTEKSLQQETARFTQAYNAITNDLNSAIDKMITSTQKPAVIFAQMFDHILEQLANFVLKWLEQQALMWAKTELLAILGKTQQTTTATTAAAAQTALLTTASAQQTAIITTAQLAQTSAIVAAQAAQVTAITTGQAAGTAALVAGHALQGASNVASVTGDAAVAAAGAYAATAMIPFVGPELAPGVAAATFAAVMAFAPLAAFEAGGVVGGMSGMPVPIMAHAGERVLSAPQTQNFERMVNSSTSNSRSAHINYSPTISGAFDHASMKQTLATHSEDILSIVRQGINSGALRR
jgi:hypothetical protein